MEALYLDLKLIQGDYVLPLEGLVWSHLKIVRCALSADAIESSQINTDY